MLDFIITILISVGLSSIIGFEREMLNRPAGLRTHILVSISATIVMYINIHMFNHFGKTVDPGRFGAQVISGVGFLGAGTILKEGANVKGLTTAASLWSVAAIGLLVGYGLFEYAIITSITIFFVLILLSKVERLLQNSSKYKITISFMTEGFDLSAIHKILKTEISDAMHISKKKNSTMTVYARIKTSEMDECIQALKALDYITDIKISR